MVLLIGHAGHDEVIGTLGQRPQRVLLVEDVEQARRIEPGDGPLYYVTQTTLSVDETREIVDVLRARFPRLEGPRKDDICYATQNRQDAVKAIVASERIELLLVLGSENSSNSQRLVEVARECGAVAHLIDAASEIDPAWLAGRTRIGVTAGASAPEDLVQSVVEFLRARGGTVRELEHVREDVHFPLPPELRAPSAAKR
jgi:4-hydroxy-3-methylbut-2-enyl diphosphate reductase